MSVVEQALRFVAVGGLITTAGYASILALIALFGVDPYVANFAVYIAGLVISYGLHATFVFRGRTGTRSFVRFLVSFGVAYLANVATLTVGLKVLKASMWTSQLAAIAVYAVLHFLLSRAYVFEKGVAWSQRHK